MLKILSREFIQDLSPGEKILPRYFGIIDQLRFVAALSIVIYHYALFFWIGFESNASLTPPFESGFLFAEMAVPFFWTISGFVFLFQYRTRVVTAGQFFKQRFARLYPLHFLTLIAVIFLQALSRETFGEELFFPNNDFYHLSLNLFFASAWGLERGPSFNGPVWSVSVEIIIYAIFFLTLPLLRLTPLASVMCFIVAAAVIEFVGFHLIVLCGFYFFCGCTCLEIVRRVPQWAMPALGVAFLIVGLPLGHLDLHETSSLQRISIFTGVILISSYLDCRYRQLSSSPSSIWNLGNYSYGIYLTHMPLMMLVANVNFFLSGLSGEVYSTRAMFFSHIILCITVAFLTYRYIELPLKKRIMRLGLSQ